jgi:hypothetical protein
MSEAGIALGKPGEIEWRGKSLRVSPITFDMEYVYAARLEKRTAEGIRRNRDALGEEGYRDALREFNKALATGEYEWTGGTAVASRATGPGSRELAWIMIVELNPSFPQAEMNAIYRDAETWGKLLDVIRRLQTPPKNGQAPAARVGANSGEPATS